MSLAHIKWYGNTTHKHIQDAFAAHGCIAGILRYKNNSIGKTDEEIAQHFNSVISPLLSDVMWLLEAGADSIRRLQAIANTNEDVGIQDE